MKLVIDLQGAQTSGSRFRGIGRYSVAFAQAVVRQAGRHDVWIALNGLFSDSIEPLRAAFDGLLPQDRIVVWQAPGPVSEINPANDWRRRAAEHLREAFLAGLAADVVHASTLFEGFVDDATTSIGAFETTPTAMTLYDLIPLIYKDIYLSNPNVAAWYARKLESARRARLWLAISEASRRDGVAHLGLPDDWVVNVSTAADAMFKPLSLSPAESQAVRQRHGLTRPFAMYTGGIDHRKNIEALIGAYARLPRGVRSTHQLAIVCAATPSKLDQLRALAGKKGLMPNDIVFTGFIPDHDMVALYNLCAGFVFPSWYEGFGLPALEAMKCGAAVIAAGCSSLPEVIGRTDALFDPKSEDDISQHLYRLLTDEGFRSDLQRSGLARAQTFSWDNSARRAWDGFERLAAQPVRCAPAAPTARPRSAVIDAKPRLAYLSPLPPQQSGIADYSADLLPELVKYYTVDVISDVAVDALNQADGGWITAHCGVHPVAWFDQHADGYDRILYHFGNSEFHRALFGLLERHPGTVVLHDFFLSGVLHLLESSGETPGAFVQALYAAHGYRAVKERYGEPDPATILYRYPANLPVLQMANGVIVHSATSRELAARWYGPEATGDWATIPLLIPLAVAAPGRDARVAARAALGLAADDFVVCSFGMLASTKLNHRLLDAWLATPMAADPHCHLVFVGHCSEIDRYTVDLSRKIAAATPRRRIHVTGYAEPMVYRRYLDAADAAVQLRTLSRGETSRAVLECIAHGVPTVFNAHGALAEIPADQGVRLPSEFADDELRAALIGLWRDPEGRRRLGASAQQRMHQSHQPAAVGRQYRDAIERFAAAGPQTRANRLISALGGLADAPGDAQEWLGAAQAIAANHPARRAPLLLVDVSASVSGKSAIPIGGDILTRAAGDGTRIEPIYLDAQGLFRYARRYTLDTLLDCPQANLDDDPLSAQTGDIYLCLDQPLVAPVDISPAHARLRQQGVAIYYALSALGHDNPAWRSYLGQWADGAICRSRASADDLVRWIGIHYPERDRRFQVGHVPPETGTVDGDIGPFVDLILQRTWLCTLQGVLAVPPDAAAAPQRA